MGKRLEVHTVPKGKGKWENTVNGEKESGHRTQKAAIEKGRTIAKGLEAEHLIHGKDGKIRESNSYGNDPNPPKDQKQ